MCVTLSSLDILRVPRRAPPRSRFPHTKDKRRSSCRERAHRLFSPLSLFLSISIYLSLSYRHCIMREKRDRLGRETGRVGQVSRAYTYAQDACGIYSRLSANSPSFRPDSCFAITRFWTETSNGAATRQNSDTRQERKARRSRPRSRSKAANRSVQMVTACCRRQQARKKFPGDVRMDVRIKTALPFRCARIEIGPVARVHAPRACARRIARAASLREVRHAHAG